MKCIEFMAPEGFEPPTPGYLLHQNEVKVQCSNQAELRSHN